MTQPASISDLISKMTGGGSAEPTNTFFSKEYRIGSSGAATLIGSQWTSLWQYNGAPGAGAVPPTSETIPTRATAGSLEQLDLSGTQSWLASSRVAANAQGLLMLYDRVAHMSGFDSSSTTTVDITLTAGRYSGSGLAEVEAWVEIYTQVGTVGQTLTINYTDSASDSASSTCVLGGTGSREAQRMIPFLRKGLRGVQTITDVTVGGAGTGTAGNFGITLVRPIATWAIGASGIAIPLTHTKGPELTEIKSGACLAFAFRPYAAGSLLLFGQLYTVQV